MVLDAVKDFDLISVQGIGIKKKFKKIKLSGFFL